MVYENVWFTSWMSNLGGATQIHLITLIDKVWSEMKCNIIWKRFSLMFSFAMYDSTSLYYHVMKNRPLQCFLHSSQLGQCSLHWILPSKLDNAVFIPLAISYHPLLYYSNIIPIILFVFQLEIFWGPVEQDIIYNINIL